MYSLLNLRSINSSAHILYGISTVQMQCVRYLYINLCSIKVHLACGPLKFQLLWSLFEIK